MRYWCLVTSKSNWNICKENQVFGLDYRYFITLKKYLKKGDKAIVYSHGGDFVAEIDVSSNFYYDSESLGWTKKKRNYLFHYRFKIKMVKEGKLHISFSTKEKEEKAKHTGPNPIDNIIFIADKGRTWNIYFQVSIISISKKDFGFISRNLK